MTFVLFYLIPQPDSDMKNFMDKFLSGQLSAEEIEQFNELLQNEEWVENTYSQLLIKEALTNNKDNDFRNLLDEITFEYKHKRASSQDDFEEAFEALQDYEENLEGITRASEIKVLKPKPKGNYIHHLPFELEKAIPKALVLIIENNDYDELLKQEIPALSIAFDIDLPPEKGFKPGRYYWKLTSKRHQVSAMGVFFIGKGLMGELGL